MAFHFFLSLQKFEYLDPFLFLLKDSFASWPPPSPLSSTNLKLGHCRLSSTVFHWSANLHLLLVFCSDCRNQVNITAQCYWSLVNTFAKFSRVSLNIGSPLIKVRRIVLELFLRKRRIPKHLTNLTGFSKFQCPDTYCTLLASFMWNSQIWMTAKVSSFISLLEWSLTSIANELLVKKF